MPTDEDAGGRGISMARKISTAAVAMLTGRIAPSSKLTELGSLAAAHALTVMYCWRAALSKFFDANPSAKPVILLPFMKWVIPHPAASRVPAMSLPSV